MKDAHDDHSRSEATDPGDDQFDALLADYFDWTDASDDPSLQLFVRTHPEWTSEPDLVEQLERFIVNNRDVENLAFCTGADWLGLSGSSSSRFSLETGSWKSTGKSERDPVPSAPHRPRQMANYDLVCEVGRGGMGVVYRAWHRQLQKHVCIKFMLQRALANDRDIERFLAEARAMAALRHPNIVAIHDVGQDDEQHFIVMEEIIGETLARRVANNPMPNQTAARTVLSIANAVSYAHGRGILHRDLKPANILVDLSGEPHVSDFGLARQIDADSLTTARGIVGTPAYIAPEALDGLPATPATDVYGLGAVLFETLTGRPPFQGITPLDTLMQLRRNETPVPSSIQPSVSRDLDTICLACMATLPSERYSSVTDVAAELERFLRGEPIQARRLPITVRTLRWMRRYPLVVTIATIVLAASLTVAAVQWHANGVTTDALNQLSAVNTGLKTAKSANDELITSLQRERETLQRHLYLSGISRSQQAIEHGNIDEAEVLLNSLLPANEGDFRDWEWYYLRNKAVQFTHSFASEDGVVFQALWSHGAKNRKQSRQSKVIVLGAKELVEWTPAIRKVTSRQPLPSDASRIAWHEDSQQIAVAMSSRIQISGPTDERTIATDSNRSIRSISWNGSGTELAIGFDDGRVAISHVDEADPRWIDSGSTDGINGIAWGSADRMLAVGSDDGSVLLLDVNDTMTPPRQVATFSEWVNDVAFAPATDLLAAVTNDGELVVWRVGSTVGDFVRQESHRSDSDTPFTSLAWHPNGKLLAVGLANGVIQIWSMDAAGFTRSLFGHRNVIASLDWSGGSQLVSSSRDGAVKTWDVESTSAGQRLNRGNTPVRHAVWNSAGTQLVWRDVEGTTAVWNQETQSTEREFYESDASATALAWHPRSDCIAFGRADTVVLFKLAAHADPTDFRAEGTVWNVQFSPDGGRIATAGAGKSVEIWDIKTGAVVSTLDHGGSVRAICWTSPSELLSLDQLATLRRWDLNGESSEPAASMKLPTDFATSIAVDPARTHLAVATQEGSLQLVDLRSFTLSGKLIGHQGTVWSVTYSDTGNRLFSGGQDGTLRVWDLKTGSQALQIHAHTTAVWSVAVHGGKVATTGADGAVRLWSGDAAR